MHIRVDDTVQVIAGSDRGARGKVLKMLASKNKLVVEGMNRVKKHVRRSEKNPRGGQLSKEMPISVSNVLLICSSCSRPSRTGARYRKDGSKERYCKACGTGTGDLGPARAAYAS